jgi:hypothetical protein
LGKLSVKQFWEAGLLLIAYCYYFSLLSDASEYSAILGYRVLQTPISLSLQKHNANGHGRKQEHAGAEHAQAGDDAVLKGV